MRVCLYDMYIYRRPLYLVKDISSVISPGSMAFGGGGDFFSGRGGGGGDLSD